MLPLIVSMALADVSSPCGTDNTCLSVLHAEPSPTRNPSLYRFADPFVRESQWTTVHAFRLLQPETEEYVMSALMAHLQHQNLQGVEEDLATLRLHPDTQIRSKFVELLPQFSLEVQTLCIQTLQTDDDWEVRESLQRVVGRHLGNTHQNILLEGLLDPNASVQLQAVKGLGWNNIPFSIDTVMPLLQDPDPRVRITTIRAIERAMPKSLGKHPMFESLMADQNTKVQREIQRFYPQ